VTLATANSPAPSISINVAGSAQSGREARKDDDHLLPLHDPSGPGVSFSELGNVMRHSFTTAPAPTTHQEEGKPPTREPPESLWEFILKLTSLIFSWFQMRLPSMYFLRVEAIILKSNISMKDFLSLQSATTNQGLAEMTGLVGALCFPDIHEMHSMKRFKKKWKTFVIRCMEEWRNLNLISTLLLRYVSSNIIQ